MRLKLILPRPEFAETFLEWRDQKASRAYNPLKDSSLEELRKDLETAPSSLANLRHDVTYRYFAELEGALVANVSLKNVSTMMRYGEIGYGVDEARHGQGIGTAAVRAFIEKVFAETDLRRLFAFVHEGNTGSRRILEKLRFRQEGLFREHYLIGGKPVNEAVYGLLRDEWRE